MRIRVLLADDHAIVRDGLRALLGIQPDLTVVGDAATGREAVTAAADLRPDIVLLDIAMPDLNGIDAARRIREVCPSARVVILSMHSTAEHVYQALQAGAHGYLLKQSAGAEAIDAIRAVHAGRRYLSQKISEAVIEDYIRYREAADTKSPLARLSSREREVLQLIVEGKSRSEIATALSLSIKTVDTYRSRMLEKLGIADVPSLVKLAMQHGLTPLP